MPPHFENSIKMLCKISRVEQKDDLSTASFPGKLLESINIWNFKILVHFYNYSRQSRGKALSIVICICQVQLDSQSPYLLKTMVYKEVMSLKVLSKQQLPPTKQQVAQWQKIHLSMQRTRVGSLAWEDPLEQEAATHSSILAWKIPWIEECCKIHLIRSQRLKTTEHTCTSFYELTCAEGPLSKPTLNS